MSVAFDILNPSKRVAKLAELSRLSSPNDVRGWEAVCV